MGMVSFDFGLGLCLYLSSDILAEDGIIFFGYYLVLLFTAPVNV